MKMGLTENDMGLFQEPPGVNDFSWDFQLPIESEQWLVLNFSWQNRDPQNRQNY